METNFEKKIVYNEILFRYARGKSLVNGYEIHPYNEILFFIDGGGKLLTEYFEENLKNSTLIIIPKNTYHQLLISDQPNYIRLVLNFSDMELPMFPMNRIKILHPLAYNISFLLERIRIVLEKDEFNENSSTLLYGAFLMLLSEVTSNLPYALIPQPRKSNELITKCIKYIDDNFASDITVEKISKEMNVSQATMFLCFKKQLGIPIYKYITEKRLIYAYKLITEGNPPTKIYSECGYKDYATFYKAYVKMFGHPPSETK
ncbi:MAG: helix-turn-helix domain-containing protein [Oscillospiraceae bacterium]|nr:helix-turn-helix domain-containing protein [Oscillospiraceae bacterium]